MLRITKDELVSMRNSDERFKIIDVLSKESYEREHIKGAISIPLADIDKETTRMLKRSDTLAVYCASFECTASTMAAKKLEELGFKYVLDYKGGLKEYKEAGLALEGSLHENGDKEGKKYCCA